MIRIGLCDDEIEILNTLHSSLETKIIETGFDANIVLTTYDQKEILKAIKNKEIDILFLDVDFKGTGKNGIEFAKELRQINREFYLIFVSAFQRYIHVSLVAKVFDYLVKPINDDVVTEIVTRLKEEFKFEKNIFVHINKWQSIRANQIYYIQRSGGRTLVNTEDGDYYTRQSLDNLIDTLPRNFKRCHRSSIINEDMVKCLDKKKGKAILLNDRHCSINNQFFV